MFREIVAEASQLILTRKSRFLEILKDRDMGLCEKIIALAKEAIGRMQEVLRNLRTPDDGVSAHIEKHLDELVGYFDEMMADTLDKAGRTTVKDGVVQNQNRRITEGMSDAERAEILKTSKLDVVEFKDTGAELTGKAVTMLKSTYKSKAEKIIKDLVDKFEVLGDYSNEEIELSFNYSNSSVGESLHHQNNRATDKAHVNFYDFAKMLYVFEDVVKNAKPIEVHSDKYVETRRRNPNLKRVFVLLGAFEDDGYVIPVEFSIKEFFRNDKNKLYVSVTLQKIEVDLMAPPPTRNGSTTSTKPTSTYSIVDIIKNVNPKDNEFLKYIPDSLLSKAQIEAKKLALEKERIRLRDMRYAYAVEEDPLKAKEMLREAAEEQGYTGDSKWRMSHQAPNSHDETAHSLDQIDRCYGADGSIYSSKAVYYYGEGRDYDDKAIRVIQSARNNPEKSIKIYRAVPKNIKDSRVRNGDWVAIVREYAEEHGERMFDEDYGIIENTVPAKYLYTNGDSINEFGYDNGNPNEVYKNTENNVKKLEITYDGDGNLIPISQRFDSENADPQYQHRRVGEEDRQVLARAAKSLARSDADNEIVKSYFARLEEYRAKQKELDGISDRLEADNWGEAKLEGSERYGLLQRQDALQKELEAADASLLEMEAMAPLRNLVESERQKAASAATEVATVKQTAKLREEKKQARELRVKHLARAERAVSGIYKWATHPTKQAHVPTSLMPLVKQLFEAVDVSHHFAQIEKLEIQRTEVNVRIGELERSGASHATIEAQKALRNELTKRIKKLEGTQHNLNWQNRLNNLREVMSTVENVPDFNVEFCEKMKADIADRIAELTTEGKTNHLYDASPELLRVYAEALESISHTIAEAGRLYGNERAANVATLGEQSIHEFQHEKRDAEKSALTAKLRRTFDIDALNPAYFAKKLGYSTEAVMKEIFDGYYQTIANIRVVDDFLEGIREKYHVSEWTGKNEKLHRVKLEQGGSVTLTTGQIMTLYALSDRPQAKKHLYGRGIQVFSGDINEAAKRAQDWREKLGDEAKRLLGKPGSDLSAFAQALFGSSDVKAVTEADVKAICSQLTGEQVACAKEMKKFLHDVIAPMGNKTSQTLYLYDMFTEENYFPIESVSTFLRMTEKDPNEKGIAARSVFSLLNKGFTKNLQEQAGNPIVIRDVFDVVTEHCFDMANYGGLGVAVSDTIRWLNYKQPGQNPFISEDSSDQRRYELLKNRSIPLSAIVQTKKIREAEEKLDVSVEQLSSSIKYSKKRTIVKKIAEEFGVFKDYENADIDMSFQFSRERFREGFNKQTAEYRNYVMMLSCFDEIIKNAIGVEAHNRNGKYKTDVSLNKVYVLVSAFVNGNDIIPVKLEVKEFLDKKNSLHVAIALESIKKDEVVMEGNTENGVTQATRSSDISVSQLLSKINPKDKSFIKYIPDGFLDSERREVKRKALEEDAKKEQKERSADSVATKTPEQDGTTVRQAMEQAWGAGAEAYIKNLLRSIEGELKGTDGARLINKAVRFGI